MKLHLKFIVSIILVIVGVKWSFPPFDLIMCGIGGFMLGSAIAKAFFINSKQDLEN